MRFQHGAHGRQGNRHQGHRTDRGHRRADSACQRRRGLSRPLPLRCHWTTAHGKVLIGLDAIGEFTRAVLPNASWDGDVTYEAVHIQFLRPDVAAVKIRQVYHSADGDTEGAPLYIMTKESDGNWLLHVGQNTEVRAG
nr:SgcJ/EcaC family oxidoreductase [Actinospica acidiphila]